MGSGLSGPPRQPAEMRGCSLCCGSRSVLCDQAEHVGNTYRGIQGSIKIDQQTMLYPMFVMKVSDALELPKVEDHQELLAKGKVTVFSLGMEAIFVSHQWLARAHPDPDQRQFAVLQDALQNIIGGMRVYDCRTSIWLLPQIGSYLAGDQGRNLADAYIWYDYFAIPQVTSARASATVCEDLGAAVSSIPAYVENCAHFFVLAPPLLHKDNGTLCNRHSWSERGWCRAELVARTFSCREAGPVCVISQGSLAVKTFPFAWIECLPRYGDFSVEEDRKKVCGFMTKCMRRRAGKFLADNRLFEFRFLQAMLAHASGDEERVETIDVWLENYKFSEPRSDGPYGWAPIHFAALEGNLPILSSIFAAGERVDRKTTGHQIEFSAWPEHTPLTIIAMFVPDSSLAVDVTKGLLAMRADANTKSCSFNRSPLNWAANGAARDPALCALLLEEGGALEDADDLGFTPLASACHQCPGASKPCSQSLTR
ncbi:unnamed protein product [Prorocentrum cordatum]|uniref:Uncharacterized protein n=1 Tax=Prorocentrum cordatum TaxID=2364126 RepID=A0ABN9UJW1_9DINO|nr:unnamed protein product [Polarella glacialis]